MSDDDLPPGMRSHGFMCGIEDHARSVFAEHQCPKGATSFYGDCDLNTGRCERCGAEVTPPYGRLIEEAFEEAGRRIAVLAPMIDAAAKRARRRLDENILAMLERTA